MKEKNLVFGILILIVGVFTSGWITGNICGHVAADRWYKDHQTPCVEQQTALQGHLPAAIPGTTLDFTHQLLKGQCLVIERGDQYVWKTCPKAPKKKHTQPKNESYIWISPLQESKDSKP